MVTGRPSALATRGFLVAAILVLGWILLPESAFPTHSEVIHAVMLALAFCFASVVAVLRVLPRAPAAGTARAGYGDRFLAAGIVSYALGWVFWALVLWRSASPSYPSGADVLWFLLYPGAAVGVYREAVAVARSHRAVLLDLALGTAGLAAALVGFGLRSLLEASDDLRLIGVDIAYLGCDAALFLLALQVLVHARFRAPAGSWALALGFLAFVLSDSAYMTVVTATGRVPTGGPIAAGWLLGLILLARSIDPDRTSSSEPTPRWSGYVIPAVGTLLALAVLVAGPVDAAASRWLAAAAIVLAAVRIGVAVTDAASLSGSHELAVTDELTGLRNRRGFFDAAVHRRPGPAALVLLDLDRFKEVNDTFGHAAGDALLAVVARRLTEASRERLGAEPDVVARLGGDEFAVSLAAGSQAQALDAARRMVDAIASRYEIDDVRLSVGVSAGVAFDGEGTTAIPELLRRADLAMYAAKGAGGRVVAFRSELDVSTPEAFARRDAQRQALVDGGVELHFQPQVDLATGRVVAVEALARLRTEDGELLQPDEVLPDLGRQDLLSALTTQVVDLALTQARRWIDAGTPMPVAVNVPADALPELAVTVRHGLAEHAVPASALSIELTEDALATDGELVGVVVRGLHALGVRVSIDHWGSGRAGLVHLRELPLAELKIDRSFVCDLVESASSRTIVESTAALAHGLGLLLVAEGVESAKDAEAARAAGCDRAQGWFFGPPAPAAELDLVLTERDAPGEPASPRTMARPD